MALENPRWGEERITNELLLKLGLRVSPRTVRKYMPKRPPGQPRADQRWATFLRNHAKAIIACDFFVTVTATFRLAHPTAAWTLQQLREEIGFEDAYRCLIHDRDSGTTPSGNPGIIWVQERSCAPARYSAACITNTRWRRHGPDRIFAHDSRQDDLLIAFRMRPTTGTTAWTRCYVPARTPFGMGKDALAIRHPDRGSTQRGTIAGAFAKQESLDEEHVHSIGQDKRYLEDHLVSRHLAIVDRHFLILDPGALDVLQRLVGALDTLDDGVLKTHCADAADFADACDRHALLLHGCGPAKAQNGQSAPVAPQWQGWRYCQVDGPLAGTDT